MREEIIEKYRTVAHLPDFLFAFTFPMRRRAVAKLTLEPGEQVLEVGCGNGANFAYLVQAVGPEGQVVGLDIRFAVSNQDMDQPWRLLEARVHRLRDRRSFVECDRFHSLFTDFCRRILTTIQDARSSGLAQRFGRRFP